MNYRFAGGSYALVGATYFGKNNSLFVPAFFTVNAGARYMFHNGGAFPFRSPTVNWRPHNQTCLDRLSITSISPSISVPA